MRTWVLIAAAALAAGAHAARAKEGAVLPPQLEQLWPPKQSVRFVPTTLEERAVFSDLIPMILREVAQKDAQPPKAVRDLARKAGFEVDVWHSSGETFWTLRERKDARHGAGAYVFRTGPAADVVVQAPHAYFDVGTGALAARLFCCAASQHRPRAFFTNTAHRYLGRPGERRLDDDHPADVAHNPEHLFQVATDLVARALPELKVVQVHGFGEVERGKDARVSLAAVVSSGTQAPAPYARTVAARLGTVLGDGVRLYPEQTEELGATRNAQGRLLQQYPRTRFVHVELSAQVRRALRDQENLAGLAEALFSPEGE